MKACGALLFLLFCVMSEADPEVQLQVNHNDQGTQLELNVNHHGDHGTADNEDNDHGAPNKEEKYLDCEDICNKFTTRSGVYTIYPTTAPVKVYCDMDTDGGKWTVIQRRVDGTLNFYRPWVQYKAGFGDASGEYWLGLENMHLLTKDKTYELRVDMEDFVGNTASASYSSFSVGSEADGYELQVAGFTDGGAGDSLAYHNQKKFSTFDNGVFKNTASRFYGAFWFSFGHHSNINGAYLWGTTAHHATSVVWFTWKGHKYSLKAVAMKIRRVRVP